MKLNFSGFTYHTEQKILKYEAKIIELTKKNHTLLAYLLNHPNQLISREELIDHVWQGRVVTNNTIDQCILKLRKNLNQAHEAEYIETVYGQGIRFIPLVSTDETITKAEPSTLVKARMNVEWYVLLLMIISLLVWLLFQNHNQSNTLINTPTEITDISQTTTPISDLDGWLLDGGANYLIYSLKQYPNLITQKPRRIESSDGDSKTLVIDLMQQNDLKNMLQLEIVQQQEFDDQSLFHAQVNLKNPQGILASSEFSDSELTTLYSKIVTWVGQVTETSETQELADAQIFSDHDFAMQDYFKAMSAQMHGDSKQAITYLEAAVAQDAGFKMAWYEMAIALRNDGDPKKAISILNAIKTEDHGFSYQVALTKGQCLDYIGEFMAAENSYQTALELAELTQSKTKLVAVYISQAILYRKTNQFEAAEFALQQAALMTDAESQSHLYGTIMNSYAKLAREMNKPILAIEKAQLAITAFQRSGDLRYEMQTKTVLASILRLRNEFAQAEQLVKESLFHAEQLNHRRGISDNRTKLARIFQQTGRFKLAFEQWQLVLNLNKELELNDNTADAYRWLLQLHLAQNNSSQADIMLRMLEQLANEHPSQEIKQVYAEAQLIIALQVNNIQEAEQQIRTLKATDFELLTMYQGDLAKAQQKYEVAEIHYLEALIQLNPTGRLDYLVLIMNKLNELYLSFHQHKLNESIRRTLHMKPFIYPIQKYQAVAAKMAGNHIQALSLLEELKLKAGDFWQYQDQLLLESWQNPQQ